MKIENSTSEKKNTKEVVGKAALVDLIADGLKVKKDISLTKGNVSSVLDEMVFQITNALKKKQEIRMFGFCTFRTADVGERQATNLRTGKKMIIPAKTVPKVKLSQTIKQEVIKSV